MTDLERKILKTIEAQRLVPKPAHQFLARRSVFWALALVSVVFGGLNFAGLLFVISDYFDTGWRILDNIHYNEALLLLPVLLILLAGLLVASAIFGLRHTRRGYRYKTSHLVATVIGASLLTGLLLHASAAGHSVHNYLLAHFDTYRAATHVPFEEWSRPEQGKLGGTVVEDFGNGFIRLMDFKNKAWLVDISAATIRLDSPIAREGDVAIEGGQTGPDTFRARMISEFD